MNLPWIENPFRLWSLEDMLKVSADDYIAIGEGIMQMKANFCIAETYDAGLIDEGVKQKLKLLLCYLKDHCDKIQLKVSSGLLAHAIDNLPQHKEELVMLDNAITLEIESHLFLFVPPDRADYYEHKIPCKLNTAFPTASRELIHAGNCFATGEYTACVFHAMRAAEIGLRALAVYLGITLPLPLELAGWQELINKIESEIKAKRQNLAKGSVKDEELKFCSNAVALFAHLNDAYRIHVAHARQIYEEDQARSILDRTKEFLESLATKIKESP